MGLEKKDLRVQKTQRALAVAMLTLLESNTFTKITVNDICAEALVSRSAFYTHFEDKYALLDTCLDHLKQRLFEESEGMDIESKIKNVLEKIKSNVRIFKNLMMSQLDTHLIEMMRQSFHRDFVHMLSARDPGGSLPLPGPVEIISVYYSSGIASAIMYWVGRKMPYSVDEMARCMCALLPQIDCLPAQQAVQE